MMTIKVPGTSANLGPGFDSCGLALKVYLTLKIGDEQEKWEISHHLGKDIPMDETNLVIQTALSLAPDMKPRKLIMESDIPSARGLGSSSAAIVAGIELASQYGHLKLTTEQKLQIAASIEGHPDNVAPAILGGFVVGSQQKNKTFAVKHSFPATGILAAIPDRELMTTLSREVLPKTIDYKEAVKASSISNVMVAAILSGDLQLAGEMMERDLWHENHRAALTPQLPMVRKIAHAFGAYGTCLSGAGPTLLIMIAEDKSSVLKQKLAETFTDMTINSFEIDYDGVKTVIE